MGVSSTLSVEGVSSTLSIVSLGSGSDSKLDEVSSLADSSTIPTSSESSSLSLKISNKPIDSIKLFSKIKVVENPSNSYDLILAHKNLGFLPPREKCQFWANFDVNKPVPLCVPL